MSYKAFSYFKWGKDGYRWKEVEGKAVIPQKKDRLQLRSLREDVVTLC